MMPRTIIVSFTPAFSLPDNSSLTGAIVACTRLAALIFTLAGGPVTFYFLTAESSAMTRRWTSSPSSEDERITRPLATSFDAQSSKDRADFATSVER